MTVDEHSRLVLTRASDIAPCAYPSEIDPYPHPESYSASMGLQVFDLITPDGDRVWVIAGWRPNGNLSCWTISDFVANRAPGKFRIDEAKSFAPLTRINASADLREQFICDYESPEPDFRFGLSAPIEPEGWIGQKIFPYGPRSTEHIVRERDSMMRLLVVDPTRAGDRSAYRRVDTWEVTSSWHGARTCRLSNRRSSRRRESANPYGNDGQYLYRLYDRAGTLLYVGITDNVFRRWQQHSKDKQWWPEVHKFTQDWYPDRPSVEAAERHSISSERPRYNILHASNQ